MSKVQEKVVVFRVGEDLFAADVQSVERVLRHQPARPIPDVPDWVDGVIEYRDRMVPVINLRKRFQLAAADARPDNRTLVMHVKGEWMAVTVDSVLEVSAGSNDVAPPPPFFRGLAGEYLKGLTRRGEELVILLDVDRLLSATERLQLERATAGAAEAAGPGEEKRAGAGRSKKR